MSSLSIQMIAKVHKDFIGCQLLLLILLVIPWCLQFNCHFTLRFTFSINFSMQIFIYLFMFTIFGFFFFSLHSFAYINDVTACTSLSSPPSDMAVNAHIFHLGQLPQSFGSTMAYLNTLFSATNHFRWYTPCYVSLSFMAFCFLWPLINIVLRSLHWRFPGSYVFFLNDSLW